MKHIWKFTNNLKMTESCIFMSYTILLTAVFNVSLILPKNSSSYLYVKILKGMINNFVLHSSNAIYENYL